jgi:hypothetical protein
MPEAGTPTRLNWRGRLLAAILIALALFQCVAAIRAAMRPPEITTTFSLIPALEIAAALVWGGLAGWAFLRLVRMRRAAVGCGVIAAFVAYSALRLAAFARADYDRDRLPFVVGTAVIIIVLLVAARRVRIDH